ncbi:putative transcription factor interactor and regulator CCHC(Zn) family [Helianthus anomalus]
MMIKRYFLNSTNPVALSDLINTLKSFEIDVTKREVNTTGYPPKSAHQQASNVSYFNASASESKAPQYNEKAVVVGDTQALKISTKNVALFNMVMSGYEALMSGELKKEIFTAKDMYQVDPDDMEEMDLKWQMAMITLSLKKFQDRIGKRLALGKAGFNKSKLRYHNCKNLGHFKRDCPLLKNEYAETPLAVRQVAIEGNNNNNTSPNTPKVYSCVRDLKQSVKVVHHRLQRRNQSKQRQTTLSFQFTLY